MAEPSFADAVRAVMAHPEWLNLQDVQVAVLGAGAEMGPLRQLLDWGATVYAVDLPNEDRWNTIMSLAKNSADAWLCLFRVVR